MSLTAYSKEEKGAFHKIWNVENVLRFNMEKAYTGHIPPTAPGIAVSVTSAS